MGEHSGAVIVYGTPRPRWLASLSRLIWAGALLARLGAPRVRISDRFRWDQIETSCKLIVRYLPAFTVLSRKEIRAEIENARWDLACLLRDQAHLLKLLHEAEWATRSLAADDPLRDELAGRRSALTAQLALLETGIEQRAGRLRDLAAQCRSFAEDEAKIRRARAAAARARRTLSRADKGIAEATTWDNRPDPAADFTERASAVIAAYRELTEDPHERALG